MNTKSKNLYNLLFNGSKDELSCEEFITLSKKYIYKLDLYDLEMLDSLIYTEILERDSLGESYDKQI